PQWFTLSLHDALPILLETYAFKRALPRLEEKHIEDLEKILERMKVKTTEKNWSDLFDLDMQFHHYIVKVCGNSRLISIYDSIHRSEEHTSELQSRENL